MKNSAREFLKAINENAEIREYMKAHALPEGAAKEDALADVAAHFGFEFTKEDLLEASRCIKDELKAAASEAEAAIKEIPLDQLDMVAGGKDHSNCKDTFKNFENCWWEDGCDVALNNYVTYLCHITSNIL